MCILLYVTRVRNDSIDSMYHSIYDTIYEKHSTYIEKKFKGTI